MMILLRLLHVVIGIFWVGSMMFTTFFLFPSLAGDPAVMGQVMQGLMRRRLMQVLPAAALVTILSGLWMVWIISGGNVGAYVHTPAGHWFTTGGGLAIVGFVLGLAFARPAAMKAARLGAQMASVTDASEKSRLQLEMKGLQRRNALITLVVATLLILAAAVMATARYL